MRRALVCLLTCCPMAALGQELFADPADTPVPPAQVQVAPSPAMLPGVVAAPPNFVLTVTDVTNPAQFNALVASANVSAVLGVIMHPAVSGSRLATLLASASNATWEKVAQALAEATPAQAAAILQTQSASGGFTAVLVALQARLTPMAIDANPIDLDVLVAVSNFASQDPRYRDISRFSYFGRQLAQVRAKVKTEGMTTANRAAIVAIYQAATEALKNYIAADQP